MIRTQVQLTEAQVRALKALAAKEDVSIAELVRRGVDCLLRGSTLSPEERKQRALSVAGRFHSGVEDLSSRHDDYLADAYSS